MTAAVVSILEKVERLTIKERSELHYWIIKKFPTPEMEELTEGDFGTLGADFFKTLDEEEKALCS